MAVAVLLTALPAVAHGTWVDARPLPGITVGGTVDEVAFLFPEALVAGEGTVTVIGPDGSPHPTDDALDYPTETVVRLGIEPLTAEGFYTVSYTLPAVDGFVFTGSHRFEYRAGAPALAPLPYARPGRGPLVGLAAIVVALSTWAVLRRRK